MKKKKIPSETPRCSHSLSETWCLTTKILELPTKPWCELLQKWLCWAGFGHETINLPRVAMLRANLMKTIIALYVQLLVKPFFATSLYFRSEIQHDSSKQWTLFYPRATNICTISLETVPHTPLNLSFYKVHTQIPGIPLANDWMWQGQGMGRGAWWSVTVSSYWFPPFSPIVICFFKAFWSKGKGTELAKKRANKQRTNEGEGNVGLGFQIHTV